MDSKLFNGTTKYKKKSYCLQITYLDYIKLHGVNGNPSGTVAGSFASRPKIDTCVPHLFSWIFSLFHQFKLKKAVSYWRNKMVAKIANKKLVRTICPSSIM